MTVLFETPSTPSAKPHKAPTAPDGPLHPTANKWSRAEAQALFALPFMDLLLKAQTIHREHHAPNEVQLSQLISDQDRRLRRRLRLLQPVCTF